MSDILERAQKNYKADVDHWSDIYTKAKEDMYFLSDNSDAQWDTKERNARTSTGRPALTIDQLGQFVHKVANDIRMNTPTINIIPAGSEADVETAEVFKGLIKNIEYSSNADEAYDTASLSAIRCSIGFIRVDHDYVDNETFEQELLIKRVVNPLSCYLDRMSTEADGCDAKHGAYVESITVAEFKSRYPNNEVSSFAEDTKEFKDDDFVNIAEYFEIKEEGKEIGVNEAGEMEEANEDVEYTSKRTVKKKKVCRYILSGSEVLKETTFPGKYIPIVPVYGEEAWIDGKRQLYSLIRKSKDAQRMYNYWKSLETELLQKQPIAPVMAAEGQLEEYAADWKDPSKAIALRYKQTDIDGNPAPMPTRLAPPQIPTGIVNAARATVDDIKATMGLYNASIGQASNETSGVAISRRKEEGDVATYHFGDNLVRSIAQVGRILVSAIPEVYDTPRIIRIIGAEDEPEQIGINGSVTEEQERPFDLRNAQYSVRVTAGASNVTRRQETAAFLEQIITKSPDMLQVFGDLLFKNMDFTGAQAIAERMKKVIDPKFLDENKDQQIDPEKEQMQMALQQAEQMMQGMQAQLAEMEQQLKNKQGEIQVKVMAEENNASNDQAKIQLEIMKLEQEQEKIRIEAGKAKEEREFKMAALGMKQRELDLKAEDMRIRAEEERMNAILDREQQESADADSQTYVGSTPTEY